MTLRIVTVAMFVYPVFLLLLSLAQSAFPQRSGLMGLAEVFAPFLFVPLTLLIPLLFVMPSLTFRVVFGLCVVVYLVRFLPHIEPATKGRGPNDLRVVSWNLGADEGGDDAVVGAYLRTGPAEIVALVEARVGNFASDEQVRATYPYSYAPFASAPSSVGLLSVFPILDSGRVPRSDGGGKVPAALWARLDLGAGRIITAIVAHPPHADTCGSKSLLPACYSPLERDNILRSLNAFALQQAATGPVLLLGDFNVAEREPGYADLSSGLLDLYRQAGTGTGNTWHPLPLELFSYSVPLLRIDYQFSAGGLEPVSSTVSCTPRGSDHCLVLGVYRQRASVAPP